MSGSISKIPILIITLVVGFIMVTTAVLPLAADYSEAKKFTNEAYYTLDKITEDSEYTLRWEVATPSVIQINGVTKDLSDLEMSRSYTLIGSESVMVRYTKVYSGTYIEILGTPYINNNTGSPLTYCEITLSGYTMTVEDDRSTPTSKTYTLTGDSYCITTGEDGEYAEVMKKSNVAAFVKGDSEIRLIGSTVGAVIIAVYGSGTIDDGITFNTVYTSDSVTTEISYTDPEPTYNKVEGYKNLYQLEKYEFTMGYNTDQSMDAIYSYFLVPAEVSADPDNPDTFRNMVRIVPLIALVALVAAAAGMIYFKGKE